MQLPGASIWPRSYSFGSDLVDSGVGAPGPQGTPGLPLDQQLYSNGRNVELQTNNQVHSTVRLQSTSTTNPNDIQDDIDIHSICFSRVSDDTVQVYTQSGPASLVTDMPAKVMAIGRFNHYLMSEAGRLRYGNQADSKQLVADWQWLGGLVTNPTEQDYNRGEFVAAMCRGKRFRTKNIWAIEDGSLQRGYCVHLVAVRKELSDGELFVGGDIEGDAKKVPGAMRKRWDSPQNGADIAAAAAGKFYWQIVPVSTRPRTKVPIELYDYTQQEGKKTVHVLGHVWYVGRVSDVFRSDKDAGYLREQAIAAVFPRSSDPETRRRAQVQLEDCQLELSIK